MNKIMWIFFALLVASWVIFGIWAYKPIKDVIKTELDISIKIIESKIVEDSSYLYLAEIDQNGYKPVKFFFKSDSQIFVGNFLKVEL